MKIDLSDPKVLAVLIDLTRAACRAILSIKKNHKLEISAKKDSSPVTAADLAANQIIVEGLKKLDATIPIVSEESLPEKLVDLDCYWLIDPLDGTKDFIRRSSDYTVNLGLVRSGVPVFGVVGVPETLDVYYGGDRVAPIKKSKENIDSPMGTRPFCFDQPQSLFSNSHRSDEEELCRRVFPASTVSRIGSSLKYVLIAGGQYDFSFRKTPTSLWDTAAAHAILLAAGGDILNRHGKSLSYNLNTILNPGFVAVGDTSRDWSDLLALLVD